MEPLKVRHSLKTHYFRQCGVTQTRAGLLSTGKKTFNTKGPKGRKCLGYTAYLLCVLRPLPVSWWNGDRVLKDVHALWTSGMLCLLESVVS